MEFIRKKFGGGNTEGLATAAISVPDECSPPQDSNTNFSLDEQPSFTLKFITWNIDGLNRENLKARTEAVCKIIEDEQADIVFLQEVVRETKQYILNRMSTLYHFWATEKDRYFLATLVKKSSASSPQVEIIDFPNSRMARNLLKVNVTYKDISLCLLNSHLESLQVGSVERKNQLRIVFKNMLEASETETVLFGGDTNLKEEELIALGGVPAGIEDVWVASGRQDRCAYTFDMTQNDNLDVKDDFKERGRYDRVYIRRSSPSKLKPTSFELIGLERLSPYGCFPSDHWGVFCHFEKDKKVI